MAACAPFELDGISNDGMGAECVPLAQLARVLRAGDQHGARRHGRHRRAARSAGRTLIRRFTLRHDRIDILPLRIRRRIEATKSED